MAESISAITLDGVTKRFGGHDAVQDVSVNIGDGEFFSLLGPSGLGSPSGRAKE